MDGVGTGGFRGFEDGIHEQIALVGWGFTDAHRFIGIHGVRRERIGIGIDRNRTDTHLTACPHHADGDFASVGNQDSSNLRHTGR
jgi:hypothetical protein